MSDEEVLAQTFMFGWVGAEPSPIILDWIERRRIGGVKIFGWNTEDTSKLADTVGRLQKAALDTPLRIPLLVATDQEGGWIRHVKGNTSETPGAMAIGATGTPRDAELSGYYIGREIAALGVNMNFAPAVDLFTNRSSTLIGPRAFSDDPVETGMLGAAFAAGLRRAGVIATAKHFPGHGATGEDSHGTLPRISADEQLLWKRELVPYRILAKEGVPAVMSGHLAFPNTPGKGTPASLSSYFLDTLLRRRIGFEGLVITDDLMMNGATEYAGSLSRAAKLALEAGNDVIMLSKTPFLNDQLWTSLLSSYRREPAFRERVQDAARRVLVLKLRALRSPEAPPFVPDPAEVAARVPDPEGRRFFLDLACRSVTRVYGPQDGVTAEKAGKVLLAGSFEDFFVSGRAAYPGASEYRFSYAPSEQTLARERGELRRRASAADTVVFCLANAAGRELLETLRDLGPKVTVVSVLSPAYLEKEDWVDSALAVYSYAPESFAAAFAALRGDIPAEGLLPYVLGGTGGAAASARGTP